MLQSQFPCESGGLPPYVDVVPEGYSHEVLAVNVSIVPQEGIAESHQHVLRWMLQFDLEVDLALLPDGIATIQGHKVIADLGYLVVIQLVLLQVRGVGISLELEHFPELLVLSHQFIQPLAVNRQGLLHRHPPDLQAPSQLVLHESSAVVPFNGCIRGELLLMKIRNSLGMVLQDSTLFRNT